MNHSQSSFQSFSNFALRLPTAAEAYDLPHSSRNHRSIRHAPTKAEIEAALTAGNPAELREISRYFARFSGIYERLLNYFSTVIDYSTILQPIYDPSAPPKDAISVFERAARLIEDIDPKLIFPSISLEILRSGVYYGLLRMDRETGSCAVQDLPSDFCRSRFKNEEGINVLEFNVNFFDSIYNTTLRATVAKRYPKAIYSLYLRRLEDKTLSPWVEIPPEEGGMVFFFNSDFVPPFAAMLPAILDLEEAKARDAEQDRNELTHLFVQQLPLNKDDELVFDLEESKEIHTATANMLRSNPNVDVVTTFAETKVLSLQHAGAATAAQNKINKYTAAVFDQSGTSSLLFNSTSNTSLGYSLRKDIAQMLAWSQQYRAWLRAYVNYHHSRKGLSFEVTILPINESLRKDQVTMYLNAAQYGYPKSYVAAALGIPQTSLLSTCDFENNLLKMQNFMAPLRNTHTETGDSLADGGGSPLTQRGSGRPSVDDTAASDKTIVNRNGDS